MGASTTAVYAAHVAEHAPAERRAGAPHVAENAAATGVVAHAMQEGSLDTNLTRNTRAPHFTPQHWLLSHMGLY